MKERMVRECNKDNGRKREGKKRRKRTKNIKH